MTFMQNMDTQSNCVSLVTESETTFSRSGGRRPDSRLGRRAKKLPESRKVGKWESGTESRKVGEWESREIAISEISRFFMDFLILKNAKIWDFSSGGRRSDSRLGRRGEKTRGKSESGKVGKSESREIH